MTAFWDWTAEWFHLFLPMQAFLLLTQPHVLYNQNENGLWNLAPIGNSFKIRWNFFNTDNIHFYENEMQWEFGNPDALPSRKWFCGNQTLTHYFVSLIWKQIIDRSNITPYEYRTAIHIRCTRLWVKNVWARIIEEYLAVVKIRILFIYSWLKLNIISSKLDMINGFYL